MEDTSSYEAQEVKVSSVSRRTDVPAFYSEWFMNRIRDGYVRYVNPFSGKIHKASLRPEDVAAFVLWSKNYSPLLPHLDELDTRGYRMLFHFTINGLPRELEPLVPNASDMVEVAKTLSQRYTQDAVLWRYDPVLISSITDQHYHLHRFRELCTALEGMVKRCYFSFAVFHRKVHRNASALRRESGIALLNLPITERITLAGQMAAIASERGIQMFTCCGDYLAGGMIEKAHCTDGDLLRSLYPERVRRFAEVPTRDGCGCCECTDIGAYDTCPHGCVYCYANSDVTTAMRNYQIHDPLTDMLADGPRLPRVESTPAQSARGGDQDLTLDL